MIEESVLEIGLVRFPHPNQIQSDTASPGTDVGNYVSPEIRPGGVAVKKQNGISRALFNVVHPGSQYLEVAGLKGKVR
jgi:hypothetical protein